MGTVLAGENCNNLVNLNLENLRNAVPAGIPLARQCFRWVTRWLSLLNEFAVNPEEFQVKVMEPVRSSARYLLSIRESNPRTTSLKGYVFSISKTRRDRYYNQDVVTISLIVPGLECCFSLRYPVASLSGLRRGSYIFGGVQPIPYVNRIHPFKLTTTQWDKSYSLSELDFLCVSIRDLDSLSRTLVFEKMCVVESFQDRRERLAMPLVLSGQLVSVSPPQITILDAYDHTRSSNLIISDDLAMSYPEGISGLKSARGKWVKILATVWYGHRVSSPSSIWPEAFKLEVVDESSCKIEDALGYLRVRGTTSSENFSKEFPSMDVSTLPPSIERSEGTLRYKSSSKATDPIQVAFLNERNRMEEIRAGQTEGYFATSLGLLDRRKLRVEGMAELLANKPVILDSILALIAVQDEEGALPEKRRDIMRFLDRDLGIAAEIYSFLRDVGLIQRSSSGYSISPFGFDIAMKSTALQVSQSLTRFLRETTSPIFSVLDAGEKTKTPPSITLGCLKQLEANGAVQAAVLGRRRFDLLWIKLPVDDQENVTHGLETQWTAYSARVLGVLESVRTSMSEAKLVELLSGSNPRLDHFGLRLVLAELQIRGKVAREVESTGNVMWEYPLGARVADNLESNPDAIISIDGMTSSLHLSQSDLVPLRLILAQLEKEGRVTEVVYERWMSGKPPNVIVKFIQRAGFEFVINSITENNGTITLAKLLPGLLHYLENLVSSHEDIWGLRWTPKEVRDRSWQIIDGMVESGLLLKDGMTYRAGKNAIRANY